MKGQKYIKFTSYSGMKYVMLFYCLVYASDLQCSSYEVNNRKFFVCHMSASSQSEARIILCVIIGFIVQRGAISKTHRIQGPAY